MDDKEVFNRKMTAEDVNCIFLTKNLTKPIDKKTFEKNLRQKMRLYVLVFDCKRKHHRISKIHGN